MSLPVLSQDADPKPSAVEAEVVQVAAHASRWNYPREVAVLPGTRIHLVEKGDTLWDLGARYLGNPFAWPQIWELNKWVADPHWIYPGDPILVDTSRAVPVPGQDLLPADVADLQPDLRRTTKSTREEYAYAIQDFAQLPFLAEGGAEAYAKGVGALKIVNRQDDSKSMQGDGDLVYLDGGSNQGYKAGDRLVTFRVQTRKFYHPDDRTHRKSMGDIIQQAGILRITHAYPAESIAVVERSLDGVQEGDFAATFQDPPHLVANLRTDIAEPIQVKPGTAKVIYIREDRPVAGAGDIVLIDQGSHGTPGLRVGDTLIVTRNRPLDPTHASAAKDFTDIYLGQCVVVRTEEHTATCRILRSKLEIQVGDILTR
jgi:hypothetical protein